MQFSPNIIIEMAVNMGIGYRIREARERLGLTQTELGRIIGVTGSAITNYEKETSSPKEPIIFRLIEALDIDPNYLFQDCVKMPDTISNITLSEYDYIRKFRFITEYSPDGADTTNAVLDKEYNMALKLKEQADYIRELEQAALEQADNRNMRLINYYYRLASAGTGQILFDTPPTKKIEIPDIPSYNKVDYAIGVNGSSMEPIFHDGDTLLIEMTDDIRQGEIGIFLVDNESYVKQLGCKELIPLNPEYPVIPLNEHSKCMGRVVNKL